MVVKLIPKSHKAKNRVRELGDRWVVVKSGVLKNGVMVDIPEENDSFFIHPEGDDRNVRWMKKVGDRDFDWEEV